MAILTYTQGESPESDRDLFCAVGQALADQAVHDDLGMAVTSRAGDIWHVSTGKDGTLHGFSVTRLLKSQKAAHVRYLYAARRHVRVKDSLLKAVVELAEHKELKTLSTRDRVNAVIWGRFGFEVVTEPKKRRGEFVRWMRRMEDKP